jgi:hypothetical protein
MVQIRTVAPWNPTCLKALQEKFYMDISRQYAQLDSVDSTHQRSTLIELLVLISIIGPLVGR